MERGEETRAIRDEVRGCVSATTLALSRSDRDEQTAALADTRAQLGVVALLLTAAGAAWWSTVDRMAGMYAGPSTRLGTLGWFMGVWTVMMAAMMLPSLVPTVAAYATLTGRREPSRPLLFACGYLLAWSAAGVAAYGLLALGKDLFAGALAWHMGGRWLTAGVLAIAALYEVTPIKDVCLVWCRNPRALLRRTWRDGRLGALAMGACNGGWCLGCSWALMATLFAVGVMNLTWMALVAALVTLEKFIPWRRPAVAVTAAFLLVLTVAIFAAPSNVPGFQVPGGTSGAMHTMR
jgi:predicted metal-binding membrane protein